MMMTLLRSKHAGGIWGTNCCLLLIVQLVWSNAVFFLNYSNYSNLPNIFIWPENPCHPHFAIFSSVCEFHPAPNFFVQDKFITSRQLSNPRIISSLHYCEHTCILSLRKRAGFYSVLKLPKYRWNKKCHLEYNAKILSSQFSFHLGVTNVYIFCVIDRWMRCLQVNLLNGNMKILYWISERYTLS